MTLSPAARAAGIAAVQSFFRDERDEAVGDLHAGFLLDAVVAAVGPALHEAAVRAVQNHLQAVVADLDVAVPPPEAAPRAPRRR